MIDYVKLLIDNPDITNLRESNFLDFKGDYSVSTGEVKEEKLTADYHFCKVTIYQSGRVYFSGSIHKMWNSINGVFAPNYIQGKPYNGYNGNLYTLEEIKFTIEIISNLLMCQPMQMIFKNIELGVNTTPYFDPQTFIKGLILHHGKAFEFRYNGRYAQATHERYYLKIYNKSLQYGITEPTLRIELKIRKTEDLKRSGIVTIQDINSKTLSACQKILLEQFKKVLYYDYTVRLNELKSNLKKQLKEYSNIKFWIYDLQPNRRHRPKAKLNEIIENHSDNLKAFLADQINQKCVIINQHSENPKCVIINRSSIETIITQSNPRICPVTEQDISMQKEASFLLSNTGLKHLEKNNPKAFKKLVEVLITGNENKFEKGIYNMLSKQIRNRYFNQRDLFNKDQKKIFFKNN